MSVSVSCPFFLNTYAFRWFENFISLRMTIRSGGDQFCEGLYDDADEDNDPFFC